MRLRVQVSTGSLGPTFGVKGTLGSFEGCFKGSFKGSREVFFFFEVFCKGRIRVYKVSIGKLGGFGFSEHLSL